MFWLAQGMPPRVVARALDVAESTFCKFCAHVVEALKCALRAPFWTDMNEPKKVGMDV